MAMTDRENDMQYPPASQPAAGGAQGGHAFGYGMGSRASQSAGAPAQAPGTGYAPAQATQAAQVTQATGMAGRGRGQSAYPAHPAQGAQAPGWAYPSAPAQYAYPNAQQRYVPPATSVPQQLDEKRRQRGPVFWLLIALAVLAFIAAALFVWFILGGGGKSARQGTAGQLEGKTPDEIQAELDRVVEEGMFNISIASTVQFASGTAPGELRIENVPGNRYLMRVVITDNDSGQKLYETDLIEPNFHIQSDTLDVDLDAGTYECTAMFYAYDPETEDLIGQAAAEMVMIVES